MEGAAQGWPVTRRLQCLLVMNLTLEKWHGGGPQPRTLALTPVHFLLLVTHSPLQSGNSHLPTIWICIQQLCARHSLDIVPHRDTAQYVSSLDLKYSPLTRQPLPRPSHSVGSIHLRPCVRRSV